MAGTHLGSETGSASAVVAEAELAGSSSIPRIVGEKCKQGEWSGGKGELNATLK